MKALSISATLQSARARTKILCSKMHASSTWAGRITAVMISVTAGIHYLVADKWRRECANILSFITHNMSEKRAALRPAELHLAELKLPAFIAGHYSPWPLEKEKDTLENIQHGSVGTEVIVALITCSVSPIDSWISVIHGSIAYN